MVERRWDELAALQCGLLTRSQLGALGVDRWAVAHRLESRVWVGVTPTVVATTTGALTREQLMWAGVLHAGEQAVVGGLTAAESHGLRNWARDEVVVLVRRGANTGDGIPGVRFVETRHDLRALRSPRRDLPVARIEPAVLMWAARERSERTAVGVVAAVVQQRLTTPDLLALWVGRLAPLRRASVFRAALADIGGGAQSVAEIDVRRMCRQHHLALPDRQVKRRDTSGRVRYTDCEWRLPDGRTLILEVDGSFHLEVGHWEDDIARERALTDATRLVIRCTARELRDEPDLVAHDLRRLGVRTA